VVRFFLQLLNHLLNDLHDTFLGTLIESLESDSLIFSYETENVFEVVRVGQILHGGLFRNEQWSQQSLLLYGRTLQFSLGDQYEIREEVHQHGLGLIAEEDCHGFLKEEIPFGVNDLQLTVDGTLTPGVSPNDFCNSNIFALTTTRSICLLFSSLTLLNICRAN
jgi:hypothetical protein